jgi:GT2 family glycosyltransferase
MSDKIGIVNPNGNSFGLHKPKDMSLEAFSRGLLRENSGKYVEIGAAVGVCYLVKRKVINEIGYWNEHFSPGYFEDTEYTMRAKKCGYKSVIASGAYIYHDEHLSFKSREKKKDFERLFRISREKFYEMYGRPERVLFIVSRAISDVTDLNKRIYEYADKGNFVEVITKDSLDGTGLINHGNVKKTVFGTAFFKIKVWLKILTKKKRYNRVFMDSYE